MKTKISIESPAPANSRPANNLKAERTEGQRGMIARIACLEVRKGITVGYHRIHGWSAKEFWKRSYGLDRLMHSIHSRAVES